MHHTVELGAVVVVVAGVVVAAVVVLDVVIVVVVIIIHLVVVSCLSYSRHGSCGCGCFLTRCYEVGVRRK